MWTFVTGLILGLAIGGTRTLWWPVLQGLLARFGDKLRGGGGS